MDIIEQNSPNKSSRNSWKPDMIVCHITEGSYSGAVSWLCNPDSQASAHFVISRKGEITQLVDLKEMAWCNGTALSPSDKRYYGKSSLAIVRNRKTNANYYTVGIETEGFSNTTNGELTDIQFDRLVELIKYIKAEIKNLYDIEIPNDRQHIVGHCEISPITKPNCPGAKFPYSKIISALEEDTEMIDTGKFKINGTIYDIDRILKDGTNYIKVAELTKAGFDIEYDAQNNLPIINTPKI